LAIGRFQNVCSLEDFPKEMSQNPLICIWQLISGNKEMENNKNKSLYFIKEMAKFQVVLGKNIFKILKKIKERNV